MRKFNLLLLAFISIFVFLGHRVDAQVIWEDDFDSYVTDSILEPQSPDWGGWGGAVTSALVSGDSAFSGSNSLKIWNGNPLGANTSASDVVRLFGDSTSGRYLFNFKVRISSDDGSGSSTGTYYNIQHLVDSSTYTGQEWAFDVYLAQGNSYINVGGQQYPIPEVMDEWVDIHHVFDLDRDMHDFFYNGVWIVSVPFSYTNRGPGGTNQLAAIDLYATCSSGCTELGYFDDFVFKHFDDPFNDAGITEAFVPTYCSGDSVDIEVALKNWGFNNLGSVDINWSVDGVAQTPFTYSNTLSPGAVDTVFLGKQVFAGTPPYDLKFWTTDPNGVTDTVAFNDTLNAQAGGPAFSGTYTVDPSLPASVTNFTSIQDLVTGLNLSGLCGATTINIASGTYNEALNLSNINGLSATNTLVIDGGDSSQTILSQGSLYATLTFDNVEHVTVRNLTLEKSSGSGDAVIFYQSDNNVLENCVARVHGNTSANYCISFTNNSSGHSTGALTNNNIVQNSRIIGGYYAIWMYGNTSTIPVGNKIIGNYIDSADYAGIWIYYADSIDIIGNNVQMGANAGSNSYAINVTYSHNMLVESNIAIGNAYGIRHYNYNWYKPEVRGNRYVNNMITSYGNYSLYMYAVDTATIWHNSVYHEGTSGYPGYLANRSGQDFSGYDVRNNIFWSENHTSYIFYTNIADTIGYNTFDYNIFGGNNTTRLYINAVYNDLQAYQAASSVNDSSLQGDPGFIWSNNLHLVGTLANDRGDKLVPVSVDIDGDVRPIGASTEPDIGADEYIPPTCPPPSNVEVTAKTDSALIVYTPNDSGNVVQIEFLSCGQSQGSGTMYSTTNDSLYFTGLSPLSCYNIYIREACGRGDTSVWIGPINFRTQLPAPTGVNCLTGTASLLYQEDFEERPELNGWIGDISVSDVQGHWNIGEPGFDGFPGSGPNYAHSGRKWIYSEVVNNYGNDFKMVSPMIDLSQVNDSAEMTFWVHGYGIGLGTFRIGYSTSQSGPFTTIYEWAAEGNQLVTTAAGPYYQTAVRLDSLVGQKIFLEFDVDPFGTMYQGQFGLDLIEVRGCVTCTTPDSLKITNTAIGEVEVDWNEKASASSWEVSYDDTPGFAPETGTRSVVSSNPATLSGLTPGTVYYYYVRSICGSGDTSGWYGPIKQVAANELPYFEDLESHGTVIGNGVRAPWPLGWYHYTEHNPNQNQLWNTRAGAATSTSGPAVDHSTGTSSGIYAYADGRGSTGDTSLFISSEIYLDTMAVSANLSFWYHMFGQTIDGLEVWVDVINGPTVLVDFILGQQQAAQSDPWIKRDIPLVGYQGEVIKVIFKATKGSGFSTSNIAIDDIGVEVVESSDIAPIAITSPGQCLGSGLQQVSVEVQNVSIDTINGFDISYVLDNGTPVMESNSTTLLPGATTIHTFATNVSIPGPGDYDLTVYTSTPVDTLNANDTIIESYSVIGVPDTTNFDNIASGTAAPEFVNGWTSSSTGTFVWTANSGGTGSGSTGPSGDNTTGSSIYMYTEASSGTTGDIASLTSYCVDLGATTVLTLEYWYHMYGSSIDRMYVEIDSAGTWVPVDTIIGQQQSAETDSFRLRQVNLDAYAALLSSTAVRFSVVRGTSFTGDVAIDDVAFRDTSLSVGLNENLGKQAAVNYELYPNPSTGQFKLVLNTANAVQDYNVSLRDVNGKEVMNDLLNVNGSLVKDYNMESLAKGVYFITIQSDEEYSVEKLIIH